MTSSTSPAARPVPGRAAPYWLRSRLLTGLVTLACVVVAAVGVRATEPADEQIVDGTIDQPVSVREGDVTVDDVRYGTYLLRDGDVSARTPGLFVVVHVSAEAPGRAPLALGRSQLTSGDRVYLPYSSLSGVRAVPGFRSQVDVVFEVDPQRIDDLTLELWPGEIITGYHQRIRVPLGVTAGRADQVRAAGPQPIADPQIYSSVSAIP